MGTTYPASLLTEVCDLRGRLGALCGCLFPRVDAPHRSVPPRLISELIEKAERLAGLPKLRGGICHPYRRKYASERSELPVKATATSGGWRDIATMLNCYDMPDVAAILAATSSPRRRWDDAGLASA